MKKTTVGRPKEKNPRNTQIKIKVTEDEYKRIEELAIQMGMNKSRLIRNLLLGNLDDAEFLQKVGILPIVKNLKEFKERMMGI